MRTPTFKALRAYDSQRNADPTISTAETMSLLMRDMRENKVRRRSGSFVPVRSQTGMTDLQWIVVKGLFSGSQPLTLGRLKLHGISAIIAAIAHRPVQQRFVGAG